MQIKLKEFIEMLEKPSEEFSMAPFWFLNDRLSKKKIKNQISDFKAKGIDIVIVHPRIGLSKKLKYLSER